MSAFYEDESVALHHGDAATALAARELGRRYAGIDLNREHLDMQVSRFSQGVLL